MDFVNRHANEARLQQRWLRWLFKTFQFIHGRAHVGRARSRGRRNPTEPHRNTTQHKNEIQFFLSNHSIYWLRCGNIGVREFRQPARDRQNNAIEPAEQCERTCKSHSMFERCVFVGVAFDVGGEGEAQRTIPLAGFACVHA